MTTHSSSEELSVATEISDAGLNNPVIIEALPMLKFIRDADRGRRISGKLPPDSEADPSVIFLIEPYYYSKLDYPQEGTWTIHIGADFQARLATRPHSKGIEHDLTVADDTEKGFHYATTEETDRILSLLEYSTNGFRQEQAQETSAKQKRPGVLQRLSALALGRNLQHK